MKSGGTLITGRNQLQWVVLLAIAVVLPTVSLLWFMSRAVSNERLVIREKLAAIYQNKLTQAGQKAAETCAANINAIGKTELTANPYLFFKQLVAGFRPHICTAFAWHSLSLGSIGVGDGVQTMFVIILYNLPGFS